MMVSDGTVFVAAFLFSLGVDLLVLALLAGRLNVRVGRARPAALAAVGCAALVVMTYMLWGSPAGEVWDAILWPLIFMTTAMLSGLLLAAGLVYLLVAAR
jgi:peptidoglycan/LPS O-acetylase OafA/YrhL